MWKQRAYSRWILHNPHRSTQYSHPLKVNTCQPYLPTSSSIYLIQRKVKATSSLCDEPALTPNQARDIACATVMDNLGSNCAFDTHQACDTRTFTSKMTETTSSDLEGQKPSLRVNLIKYLENSLVPILWWTGLINPQDAINRAKPAYRTNPSHSGYAIGLAMTTYWCFALRLEIVLYLFATPKMSAVSLSLRCDLKFPRIVGRDAESVVLALRGDVKSMKMRLANNDLNLSDVLPNGSTLLHVCSPLSYRQRLTNHDLARCYAKSFRDGEISNPAKGFSEFDGRLWGVRCQMKRC